MGSWSVRGRGGECKEGEDGVLECEGERVRVGGG